ncbi:MAG: hypothetical protein GX649_03285 [Chloroflexi bacterium]|nr:hypothetical protein [Chloroflexota bacterium]
MPTPSQRALFRRALSAVAAAALTFLPVGLLGCARSGGDRMSESTTVGIPQIDAEAPAHTETATFALG